MTDQTAAHEAAHEENAERVMSAWRKAEGREANDAARSAWNDLPRFHFNAVISMSGNGKVHRVWTPSAKYLSQPWCGASRWNGGQARVTDSPVTCLKCLR